MSSIEDKILNGPTIHYCDAENNDIRSNEDSNDEDSHHSFTTNDASSLFVRPNDEQADSFKGRHRFPSGSFNTGPKGVLEDFRRDTNPRTELDRTQDGHEDIDREFQELMNDDSIIKTIAARRLAQKCQSNLEKSFIQVFRLKSGAELLAAIDNEQPNVLVLVYIYTKDSMVCSRFDKFLEPLAESLKHIKIVTLDASVAGLSDNFKQNGVPALLAYRGGELIKSLVQLEDYLDRDFDHSHIQELLVDNGLIV